jgi:hypothetical protein
MGATVTGQLKQRPGDQPLPTAGRECVQDRLIDEIRARRELGVQRYGSPLMTHNGRDALQDAWEESIDLAVYLTQMRMERADTTEAVDLLDRWLAAHENEPGSALIAKARELLTGQAAPQSTMPAIDPHEFRVDVFSNNNSSSARATHLPTGTVATGDNRHEVLARCKALVAEKAQAADG